MFGRNNIREGMAVYSSDGHKVGKIVRCGATDFEIEKGFFLPKEYLATYDLITRVEGDNAYLSLTKDALLSRASGTWTGATATTTGTTERTFGKDEVRVPVAREELDVIKERRESGGVRITKEVKTEEKHFTVPVTKEEVRVERVPASASRTPIPGETRFESETIRVPVHEEEVEIRKRPVVREEVRVAKERHTEEVPVDETVRREEVNVKHEEPFKAGSRDKDWKF